MHPYLDKAIHVSFHIRNGHSLHDDVHDATLEGLPLLTGRLGEAGGSSCSCRDAQTCWLPLQLPPAAGRKLKKLRRKDINIMQLFLQNIQ